MNVDVYLTDNLSLNTLETGASLHADCVVDIRFTEPGTARPTCERVTRRLANLLIEYNQAPVDLSERYAAEQMLLPTLVKNTGRRLVIVTEQTALVAAFCAAWRINVKRIDADGGAAIAIDADQSVEKMQDQELLLAA